jgi:hypothetical protein
MSGVGGEVAGDQHAVVEELDHLIANLLQDVVDARFKSHWLRHTFPFHGVETLPRFRSVSTDES